MRKKFLLKKILLGEKSGLNKKIRNKNISRFENREIWWEKGELPSEIKSE
jgi:hypothetical protein